MLIDYKITRITRYDDVTEVLLRLYEGEVTTEVEENEVGSLVPVERYRRSKVLGDWEIKYSGDIAPTREERDEYLRRMLDDKLQQEAVTLGTQVISDQADAKPFNNVSYEKDVYTKRQVVAKGKD